MVLSEIEIAEIEGRLRTMPLGQYREFMASAPSDIAALIASHRELRARVAELERQVDKFSRLADQRHDMLTAQRQLNNEMHRHVSDSQRAIEKLSQVIFNNEHAKHARAAIISVIKAKRDEWKQRGLQMWRYNEADRENETERQSKGDRLLIRSDAADELLAAIKGMEGK